MLLVGLTGNIASGKSSVARLLAAHGATIVDADLLAREVVQPGQPALERIVALWGDEMLNPDGTLDRAALRQRVFGHQAELDALNEIVHPEVADLSGRRVDEARERGDPIVVYDVPLLFERKLTEQFDCIVLVDAPRPVRLERLVRDRELHEAEAMKMIAAQIPAELKRARADFVIDNVGTREELAAEVSRVWAALEREKGATISSHSPQRVLS